MSPGTLNPPSEASFEVMLAFFKSLANESRLRIVGLLAARPYHVKELATELALKEPTVCHHLACLSDLGLVEMSAQGNTHYYSLRSQELRRLGRSIFSQGGAIASAQPNPVQWEERVLGNFLDGVTLKSIPASRRKRWAILKWLTLKFEVGQRYPEARLNAMIQEHHWDSATLRREMIGYRMLAREAGIYWRLPEAEWIAA